MITSLLNGLQACNTPDQTVSGIIAYMNKHVLKLGTLLSSVSDFLADGSFTDSLGNAEAIILDAGYSGSDVKTFTAVGAIKDGLRQMNTTDKDASTISVPCTTSNDTLVMMSLEEVTDRMTEAYSVSQGLISTLSGVVEAIRSGSDDALAVIERHLGAISIKQSISSSIKTGLTSIALTMNGLNANNLSAAMPAILSIFGFSSSKTAMADNEISTYTGVHGLTAVLSSFFDTTVDAMTRLPTVFVNTIGILGGALYSIGSWIADNLILWVINKIQTATGQNDALSPISGGDGTVGVSYTYWIPATSSYRNYGSRLEAAFSALQSNSIQILVPTGTFFCQKDGDTGYQISFVPKMLNPQVVECAMYKYFNLGREDVLLWSWRYSSDDKLYYTRQGNVGNNSFTCTVDTAVQFLKTIFSSNELYTVDKYMAIDSYYATGVMFSQWLTIIMCELYVHAMNDQWDNSTTMANLFNMATQSGPGAVIIQQSGGFDPVSVTNELMARISMSMQNNSTAFNGSHNGAVDPDYNISDFVSYETYTQIYVGLLDAFCDMCDSVIIPTSVESGTGIFVPYSTTIIHPQPSWYIPSDSENVATAKSLLKNSAIVIAVIVAVIVGAKVLKHMRMRSFELAAKAGASSWDAAQSGDSALMAAAYKWDKKSRLLARITGMATDAAASAITNVPSSNGLTVRVGQLIRSDFE